MHGAFVHLHRTGRPGATSQSAPTSCALSQAPARRRAAGENQPEETPEPPEPGSLLSGAGAASDGSGSEAGSDDDGAGGGVLSAAAFARSRRPDSAYHYGGTGIPAHRSAAAASALDPLHEGGGGSEDAGSAGGWCLVFGFGCAAGTWSASGWFFAALAAATHVGARRGEHEMLLGLALFMCICSVTCSARPRDRAPCPMCFAFVSGPH